MEDEEYVAGTLTLRAFAPESRVGQFDQPGRGDECQTVTVQHLVAVGESV